MIRLNIKGIPKNLEERIIGRISYHESAAGKIKLVKTSDDWYRIQGNDQCQKDTIYILDRHLGKTMLEKIPSYARLIYNADTMYLKDGDIVSMNSDGRVSTLFRQDSEHNSLFITDRCNSNCLMCSQPPRNKDDLDYFWRLNKELIPLIPENTNLLGVTGGEPTLLGSRFVDLIALLKKYLPETGVHILTNGRSFAWKNFVAKISKEANDNVVYGIPLYSDYYHTHDYIVQTKGAYDQTLIGLYNLARYQLRIEIRVVLHKQSYERLPDLARFIFKNLPFVEHIAFMGLEYTGYTSINDQVLWMEPKEYMNQLEEAVLYLDCLGMNVSIYNLQHCLLKPSLWRFSRRSISDWKQEYLDPCNKCTKLESCGGVFATSKKLSSLISPL